MHKLDKKNQNLTSIEGGELSHSLARIDLSKNSLSKLDISHCRQLRWLNLSHNKLASIEGFADLPELEVLNVSHNELEGKINVGRLKQLKALVLNGNQLTTIKGLEKLHRLETLIVSNNDLSDLGGWISKSVSLKKLSASNNPNIQSFDGLRGLVRMKELRLNGTGMTRVHAFVERMGQLRILEVGGNRITSWEDVGRLPEGMWQLNLKGNPICDDTGVRPAYCQQVSAPGRHRRPEKARKKRQAWFNEQERRTAKNGYGR
jgi:Leucine-rich repeat (LRR) protein